MKAEEPEQSFTKTLREFVDENKLKGPDRALLMNEGLGPAFVAHGGGAERRVVGLLVAAESRRERASMAIDLVAIRTSERQARAMRGLTWALVGFTAVQFLVEVGLWGWLAGAWPAVRRWLATLPSLVR